MFRLWKCCLFEDSKEHAGRVLGYFAVMLCQASFFIGALYHKSTFNKKLAFLA